MSIGRDVQELHGHTHAVVFPVDRSLEDGIDAKLPRNLGQMLLCPFVIHRGRVGDDPQRFNPGKLGDELFGHAIREVILGRVSGEILKGDHRNRPDCVSVFIEVLPTKPPCDPRRHPETREIPPRSDCAGSTRLPRNEQHLEGIRSSFTICRPPGLPLRRQPQPVHHQTLL
jgi:hypothetical protein